MMMVQIIYQINCSFVSLHHLIIYHHYLFDYNNALFLLTINIMGNSFLNYVTCFGGMQLIYNEMHADREYHSISMNNCAVGIFYIDMLQISYKVTLMIINIQVQHNIHVFYPSRNRNK